MRRPLPGVRRIAVLRANALGDYLFTLPALEALRATYPAAELVLLGRAWHASFLADRPGPVDRVIVVPGDDRPGAQVGGRFGDAPWLAASPRERQVFADGIRAGGFNLAVQLHGGGRNSNPLVASLGATHTIGLRSDDAPPLDDWVRYVYYQHEVLRSLEVVALAGARPVTLQPHIALTAEDEHAASQLLGERAALAVLHPGASDPRRHWPADRFAAVGDALAAAGFDVLVTGNQEEMELADHVVRTMERRATSLAGLTSLGALAGLLARASIVISNDSGPLHLAAAVGAPTVGIYWCANLINGGPLTRARHRPVVSWRLECPVCGVDSSRGSCAHAESFVAEVPVADVLDQAFDLLGVARRMHAVTV